MWVLPGNVCAISDSPTAATFQAKDLAVLKETTCPSSQDLTSLLDTPLGMEHQMAATLTDASLSCAGPQVSTPADVAVEVRRVSKIFGEGETAIQALEDVSIAIRANEFFTLLGPSGCGKTTLLRLIAGFEHPTQGRILLQGKDISDQPPYRRPINTVFQSYALFPHLSVEDNIGFGLDMLGRPKTEIRATVEHMLEMVKMKAQRGRRPGELSGGQQQRVALARALAPRPRVLLLDEPLSALDLKLRKEMQIELKRLQHETGITFVFVTHDQEEALTMSDRIAVMNEGRILQIGSPRDIYDRPAVRFVASFIGETNLLMAEVLAIDGKRARLRLLAGIEATANIPPGSTLEGEVTVAVRPEHVRLANADAPGSMTGTLGDVVYFGTDTNFHVRLGDGETVVARVQNMCDGALPPDAGARVGVWVQPGAIQILRD
jgi:spermidine/putrescine transport system ATP-binding protein